MKKHYGQKLEISHASKILTNERQILVLSQLSNYYCNSWTGNDLPNVYIIFFQGFCFVKVKIKIQYLVKLFLVIRDTERMNWKQLVIFSIKHAYITHMHIIIHKIYGDSVKNYFVLSSNLSFTNSWHNMYYLLLRSSLVSLDSIEVVRIMLNRQLQYLFKILLFV